MRPWIAAALLLLVSPAFAAPLEKGTVRFEPIGDQANVPERYRLDAHSFPFEVEPPSALPPERLQTHRNPSEASGRSGNRERLVRGEFRLADTRQQPKRLTVLEPNISQR